MLDTPQEVVIEGGRFLFTMPKGWEPCEREEHMETEKLPLFALALQTMKVPDKQEAAFFLRNFMNGRRVFSSSAVEPLPNKNLFYSNEEMIMPLDREGNHIGLMVTSWMVGQVAAKDAVRVAYFNIRTLTADNDDPRWEEQKAFFSQAAREAQFSNVLMPQERFIAPGEREEFKYWTHPFWNENPEG